MPYKLSPSALSLMKDCSRCFWLLHNKGKKRPDSIFPSLPSGMDRILKNHFDSFMEQGKLPPELSENLDCNKLKLFDDKELLRTWRNNLRGISIQDNEGNVLHGAVDNILVNPENNKLIVLDYKTRGYPLKEDTHKHYIDQLAIYNFLLREIGYETEDYAFLLFYIPSKVLESGEVIFDTTLKKIEINTNQAEELWQKALDLLEGPCPEKNQKTLEDNPESQVCQWCNW